MNVAQTCKSEHLNYEKCIQTINKNFEELWTENVQINRRNGTFKQDKGVECNVMSDKTFSSLDIKRKLSSSKCKLLSYTGHKMALLGKKSITCEYKW